MRTARLRDERQFSVDGPSDVGEHFDFGMQVNPDVPVPQRMQEDGLVPSGKRNGPTFYLVAEDVIAITRLLKDLRVARDRPRALPPLKNRLDLWRFSLQAKIDRMATATEHLDHRCGHQHVTHAAAQVHENVLLHVAFVLPIRNPRAGTLRAVLVCAWPSELIQPSPSTASPLRSQVNLIVSAVGFTTSISLAWRRLRLPTRSRGSLAIGHGTWAAFATAAPLAPRSEGGSPKPSSTSLSIASASA